MYECMGPFKKKILYQKVYYNCVLFVTADEENEKKNWVWPKPKNVQAYFKAYKFFKVG